MCVSLGNLCTTLTTVVVGATPVGWIYRWIHQEFAQSRHVYSEYLKLKFLFPKAIGTMRHQTKVICERKRPTQPTKVSSCRGDEATYFTDNFELDIHLLNSHVSQGRNELKIYDDQKNNHSSISM